MFRKEKFTPEGEFLKLKSRLTPEEGVQNQEYEPEVEEEPHAHVPEPEAPVSAPVEVAPAVRTSGRVRSQPERYGSPPLPPPRCCISL